jgi:hypothetical protein
MNAPILQISWLHRRLFLFVMCLTFIALAIGVFMLPIPRSIVRTSIEIGAEPAEQVARRIPGVYVPIILLAMSERGVPASTLGPLQRSSVENIGRSLILITAIEASAEKEAREFQQAIADQIVKDETPRVQALREGVGARIALAKSASDSLDSLNGSMTKELERIRILSENLQGQIETQQAKLATLRQRTETAQHPPDRSTIEEEMLELYRQISNQWTLVGDLTLERSRLLRDIATTNRAKEQQIQQMADAQLDQRLLAETHVLMAPSLMPVTANYGRLTLLFVAIAISILVAFGAVVLLHHFGEWNN